MDLRMKAVILWRNMYSPPVAVWWADAQERLWSFAVEPDDPAVRIGAGTMAARAPGTSWGQFFDLLAQRAPSPLNYEVFNTDNPRRLLMKLRKMDSAA
jgi:hypothetical protein